MANAQKITEIIDEKALKDWERFIDSLVVGQSNMAKVVTEANEMNKSLSGAKSLSQFSKDAEKAAISMEKLAQEQAKTKILNDRLIQSEIKTAQLIEKRAIKEAEAAKTSERIARTREAASQRMIDNEKNMAASAEKTGDVIIQSEKDIERGLIASQAAAISSGNAKKKASQESKIAIEEETFAYSEYRNTLDTVIRRNLELKMELKEIKDEYKLLGDRVPISKTIAYEKEVNQLNEAIKANNTEIRRLSKENISAEGSMDSLESQLNSLRAAYRGLSAEEKETGTEAQKLRSEIEKLDAQFKEQKKSIGQHQDEVGNYALIWDKVPGPIRNVIDNLNGAGEAGEKVTFSGIINGLKALTAQAWAFIKTPIGAAIAAITAVVSGAKIWYDYNKGLQEATKLTEQLTGASGDSAKTIRDDLMATSESFDKEFNGVLRTANTLSSEFGISFSETADLINIGMVRGADASNQFLDNLREYAPQMRAAGLSANEMVAVLIRSEKEGVFSDKGIDAIKEATLRIREMTVNTRKALTDINIDADDMQSKLLSGQMTMFQAIQQVSTAMGGFSDNSREVGQVLADVFAGPGEDAGLNYLKMLGDINLEQETSLDNLTEIEKAQMMQLEATEALNKEFSSLFDSTGGGFELMIANIKVLATDLLVKLLRGVRNVYNWFVELYNESFLFRGLIESIPLAFRSVMAAGRLMFNSIMNGFSAIGNTIKAILTGNLDDLPGIWKSYLSEMESEAVKFAKSTGSNLKSAFNNTVSGRAQRLEGYDLVEDLTGSTSSAPGGSAGSVGVEDPKAVDKAIKMRKMLNDKLIELQAQKLANEKRLLDEASEYNMKIVNDELNSFSDRFNNLTEFNSNRRLSIEKEQESELAQLNKLKNEALETRKEGSLEQYKVELQIIQEKEKEIRDRALKANQDLNDEIKKQTLVLFQDRYDAETNLTLTLLEQRIQDELYVLAERYRKGEIGERDYQEGRLNIQQDANLEYIGSEMRQLEAIIKLGKEKNIDTRSLEVQLASLKIDLSKEATDQQISDIERLIDMEKKAADVRKDLYIEIANASFELFDTLMERRIGDIDRDIELTEENKERELENVENSSLNEEEKKRRIYTINQNYEQKQTELERRRKEAEIKQARFQKAQAVMNIALSTAQGIARAFADFWFPTAIPIAATIGVLGAVQLATALAQPLPQYWTGTESSKGGPAHVGERGSELYITPSGSLGMTPNRDTIVNLEEGTKIFNAQETRKIMSGSSTKSDSAIIQKALEENSITNRKLLKAFESSEVHSTVITKSGWRSQINKNRDFKNYLKRNGIK